jgi:protein SCO1/2
MLIYFGFTYCPDACPTALGVMSAAIDKLDVAADRVVPILITVDPERDTPQVLKDYVSNFHPQMVRLTGTKEQIAQAAKAYRVFYQKAPGATADEYLMDHTLLIYLMDGDGKYITHFGPDATPDQVAEEIRKHL